MVAVDWRGPNHFHPSNLPLEYHGQGCDCRKCRADHHRLQVSRALERLSVGTLACRDMHAVALAVRDGA